MVTHSVTVTVTVAGAHAERRISLCYLPNTKAVNPQLTCLLTLCGDYSQRKRGESEELVAEHVDYGNFLELEM